MRTPVISRMLPRPAPPSPVYLPADRPGGGSAPRRPDLTFPAPVAEAVRAAYAQAECILEYGSGGSTVLAAEKVSGAGPR